MSTCGSGLTEVSRAIGRPRDAWPRGLSCQSRGLDGDAKALFSSGFDRLAYLCQMQVRRGAAAQVCGLIRSLKACVGRLACDAI